MSEMAIFDPAMCCSTGVCGSSVDPELLRVAAVIENLKKPELKWQDTTFPPSRRHLYAVRQLPTY